MSSHDHVDPPAVPGDRLAADGWQLVERDRGRRAGYPGGSVHGHTLVYEDGPLRAALRDATDGDVDRPWRVFFATRLEFRPPPAPGFGAVALPAVASAADREFREDLADRGFEAVEHSGSERIRLADGETARLYRYGARNPVAFDGVGAVEAGGLLAVRNRGDRFRLVGGVYPGEGFAALLDRAGVEGHDPGTYFEDLVALMRAVA